MQNSEHFAALTACVTMAGTTNESMFPHAGDTTVEPPRDEESAIHPIQPTKPYNFDDVRGWRAYRVLQPCKGMIHDVRRRLPYYWSDLYYSLTYRTFASTVRIYFVK